MYRINQFQMQTGGEGSTNLKFLWPLLMEVPFHRHHQSERAEEMKEGVTILHPFFFLSLGCGFVRSPSKLN